MGIIFAMASLVFTGLNDFLFKQYINRHQEPLGFFVAGVGLVWTLVLGTALCLTGGSLTFSHWSTSLGAGVASVLANLVFIASFRTMPLSTGATIYRLNLVVVAILGFVWLGEAITSWKLVGIALGVVAVLLLWRADRPGDGPRTTAIGAAMLVVACILRAVMGILYKQSTLLGINPLEVLTLGGICWIIGGFAFAGLRGETWPRTFRTARFSLLSGLLVCCITYFMLAAVRFADASIAIPITQLSFVITCILAASFHGEKLGPVKITAMATAVGCVAALCRA